MTEPTEPTVMDLAEFQASGYLQEVNRQFLHPLGLAFAVMRETDGRIVFSGILDARDDPEGIYFGDTDLKPLADNVRYLAEERTSARYVALGYWTQPVKPIPPSRVDRRRRCPECTGIGLCACEITRHRDDLWNDAGPSRQETP